MTLKISRVDTWAAPLDDECGSLAAKLEALANAGVNLEFVIARRAPDRPGTGVLFVTPITGAAKIRAAEQAGFRRTKSLFTVRIEGPDRKGRGSAIAQALANKGLNLNGMSAATMKGTFVAHVGLDSPEEAARAVRALKAL